MKKSIFILFILAVFCARSYANHITGGEISYRLIQQLPTGEFQYAATLKLFRNCGNVGAPLDPNAAIAVFNKSNGVLVSSFSVQLGQSMELNLTTPGPCITNAPTVCYQVGIYEFTVTLPPSTGGYIISYQRCCRIDGISNLSGSSGIGATYTAEIPGTSALPSGPENNSARFIGTDTVIVCANNAFTYSFAAVDPDQNDVLSYYFCSAYEGASSTAPQPNPPSAPPYRSASYAAPYSGSSPLGPTININPSTGLITGIAPSSGIYVVTVCVSEIRSGVLIATQRKDLQIKIGDCDIAKASLDPEYISCDGLTLNFQNNNNSPLINSFYWEFGDPASGVNNTSNVATPSHSFTVAGDYTIKLVTNRNQECSDSTTAVVKVYPGFFPAFTTQGICLRNPVLFQDQTTTNYGVVDSWSWNFGDELTTTDVSTIKNPSWTYGSIGPKEIIFTVTNSKGCKKTIKDTVIIIDKPPITLAFKDTLICVPDAVQLQASGTGNFSWTPLVNIVNANTGTPTVNPPTTTTYHVQLDEQGCINTDSVRVRVVNFVTLIPMNDTVICQTDAAQLRVISDGLRYQWTPAASLNDPTLQNPIAIAGVTRTYQVIARIGSCSATRNINVTAIPYPRANAGPDTTICYNTPAFLHGTHDGSSFNWSPAVYLANPTSLNTVATPPRTTPFILSSFDTRGCPKPGRDTVLVTVRPKINAFAGRDTAVVVGQPLQFNASGGVNYVWTPGTGLSSTSIFNPVGVYDGSFDSIRYMVRVFDQAGCSDSASVGVKIFKTVPSVFVPTAFTPNDDGLNDMIMPIAVGIQRINYFRIFNRWGQLLFTTTTNGQGWDGKINGVPQGTNTFVWMVSAVDYLGKPYFMKGVVTLIR